MSTVIALYDYTQFPNELRIKINIKAYSKKSTSEFLLFLFVLFSVFLYYTEILLSRLLQFFSQSGISQSSGSQDVLPHSSLGTPALCLETPHGLQCTCRSSAQHVCSKPSMPEACGISCTCTAQTSCAWGGGLGFPATRCTHHQGLPQALTQELTSLVLLHMHRPQAELPSQQINKKGHIFSMNNGRQHTYIRVCGQ